MSRGVAGFSPAALKKARLGARLTLVQLAANMGVGENTVQRWEAGTSQPIPEHLRSLAKALDLDVRDLLPRRVSATPSIKDLRELASLTLEEAEAASGVSRSSLRRMERGAAHLHTSRVTKLAEAYGVTEAELINAAAVSVALRASMGPTKQGKLGSV
jgi:transcriptional regulator with XRE-family HTH domain